MEKYVPPKSSPKPSDYAAFMESLSGPARELHEMAERLLGSSYFVQWTHGYRTWKATVKK